MPSDSESTQEPPCEPEPTGPPLPEGMLPSYTKKVTFGCGKVYLTICEENRKPIRVDVVVGKTGNCERALLSALCCLINLHLEKGESVERLFLELNNTYCDKGIAGPGRKSCVDALALLLRTYVPAMGADPSPLWENGDAQSEETETGDS